MTELYDALIAAGAPDDKARAASQTVADYDSPFSRIESHLRVLKRLVGFVLAGVAATALRLFAG